MHGEGKESKIYDAIEIKTLVSIFKFPNRDTKESLDLKERIMKCNRKDVFRTSLIQHYINEDWNGFASKYARIELILYLCFVGLTMLQFWQTTSDDAVFSSRPAFSKVLIPSLSVTLLVFFIFKEIFQMINESSGYLFDKEYSPQFENIGDMIAYCLVSIC